MKNNLMLVSPSEAYISELLAYRNDFLENADSMDGCGPLKRYENMKDYLKMVEQYLNPDTLPDGMVVASQFLCVRKSDHRIVGMIQVRHYFNEYVEKYAGHIGYSVRPSERQKGYATWMLHNIMPFCRSIGLEKILVCCLDHNEASRRTILKNGGVYEKTVFCEERNEKLERYWIDLKEQESIETNHLRLRKARLEDMDAIWKNVWSDETIAKNMLWPPVKSREEAQERIVRTIAYQRKIPAYFVCLKDTDEPIGFAGFKEEKPKTYEECGICIAANHQKKGYGKEVVNALLFAAFDLLGGEKFIYGCFQENTASRRLAESLGFHYTHSKPEVRAWDGYQYVADYFLLTSNEMKK